MGGEPVDPVASGYDALYEAWGRSPTLRRIWRDHVTGPGYPEAYDHISFLPLPALESLTAGLALQPGQLLVDLACGAGGPGLWAANRTGARLIGIDLSPVAVARASERAAALGVADGAEFRQGSFEATGLGDAQADAVMSVDALQYAPDKGRAVAEMARILRPGGRLAVAAFALDPERVAGLPVWADPVPDHRPLLEAAGFEVLADDDLPGWRDQVAAAFGAVLADAGALGAELGEEATAALVLEASVTLELEPYCGHPLLIARRRDTA